MTAAPELVPAQPNLQVGGNAVTLVHLSCMSIGVGRLYSVDAMFSKWLNLVTVHD
jgi:hypothetical protein